jgi:uncharacterized protein YbjQ (UPF0145 family)
MANFWVGSVSASELLALKHIGVEPVGQVYGVSVKGLATSYFPVVTSEVVGEVEGFSQMLSECMFLINAQADQVGANGVLDCKVDYDVDLELIDIGYLKYTLQITGTAVQDRDSKCEHRYFATMSPCELIAMRKAGYEPCGLAIGNCTYFQVAWRQQPKLGPFGTWANEEIKELTQGPYTAREIAMERLMNMARNVGGTGIVGVQLETEVSPSGSLVLGTMAAFCRMFLYGTAIRSNPFPSSQVSVMTTVPIGRD